MNKVPESSTLQYAHIITVSWYKVSHRLLKFDLKFQLQAPLFIHGFVDGSRMG